MKKMIFTYVTGCLLLLPTHGYSDVMNAQISIAAVSEVLMGEYGNNIDKDKFVSDIGKISASDISVRNVMEACWGAVIGDGGHTASENKIFDTCYKFIVEVVKVQNKHLNTNEERKEKLSAICNIQVKMPAAAGNPEGILFTRTRSLMLGLSQEDKQKVETLLNNPRTRLEQSHYNSTVYMTATWDKEHCHKVLGLD